MQNISSKQPCVDKYGDYDQESDGVLLPDGEHTLDNCKKTASNPEQIKENTVTKESLIPTNESTERLI